MKSIIPVNPIENICQKVIAIPVPPVDAVLTSKRAKAYVDVAGIDIKSSFVGIFHLRVPASSM